MKQQADTINECTNDAPFQDFSQSGGFLHNDLGQTKKEKVHNQVQNKDHFYVYRLHNVS